MRAARCCELLLACGLLSACMAAREEHSAITAATNTHLTTPDYRKAASLNAELGLEYIRRNWLDRARHKLLKAEKQAALPVVYHGFGRYYARLGEDTRAEQAFRKALALAPNDSRTLVAYADFLCSRADYQRAGICFHQALAAPGDFQVADIDEAYGRCEYRQGNYDRARALFRAALQHQADLPLSHWYLACIAINHQDYRLADQYLQRYTQLAGLSYAVLQKRIRIAEALNDTRQAAGLRLLRHSRFRQTRNG